VSVKPLILLTGIKVTSGCVSKTSEHLLLGRKGNVLSPFFAGPNVMVNSPSVSSCIS